jgi:hypothetical protein
MDVIRHDDERDEVVQGANPLAISNCLRNAFGDSRLLEPGGTQRCALKLEVGGSECASVAAGSQGEGAVKSKCYEELCAVGLEVGELTAVFHVI